MHACVHACVFLIPERCGQLEGSDSRGGKAQGVSVGDLLHRTVEALNIVPLQHEDGLAGVDVHLQGESTS